VSKQKQRPKPISPRRTGSAAAIPFLILILARIVAGFFPASMFWGFNFHGFLSDTFVFTLALLSLAAAVPAIAEQLLDAFSKIAARVFPENARQSLVVHAAIAAAFGLACWQFVVPFAFLGDGVHVARALFRYNTGAGLAYGTLWLEPASVLVYNTLIKAFMPVQSGSVSVDISAYTRIFVYVSFILGVLYVFAVLRLSAGVSSIPLRRLAVASGIFGCAGIIFYFGYVEFYAFLYFFGSIFLLAATQEVRLTRFPLWTTISLAAAVIFHLSALVFVPVYLVTLWLWRTSGRVDASEQVASYVKTWTWIMAVVLLVAFGGYLWMDISAGNNYFISLSSDHGYLTLFHPLHLLDVLNNLVLHSPVGLALLVLIVVLRRQIPVQDPRFLIAASSTVVWAALCLAHSAIARDWDVYALLGVSMILTGYFFVENLNTESTRRYCIAQLVVQPLLLVIPWIALNASFEPSLKRYSAITESYAKVLPPEVSLGHLETLRSAFVTAHLPEGEILTVVRCLQLKFDPYECYKLTRAFENSQEASPLMLRAAESALNLIITQPDSIRAKPVGQDEKARATTLNDVYFNLTKAVVHLASEDQKVAFALSALNPLYEKRIKTFDIAAYIGNRYFDAKQYKESLRWFEKALPDSGLATAEGRKSLSYILQGMGIIYANMNEQERSLEYFRRAVSYPDVPAMTWSDYGFAYYTFARFQEAVQPFSRALKLDSSNANALYCLGKIYLHDPARHGSGRYLLAKFLRVEPGSPRARDARKIMDKSPDQLGKMTF
jgi:tetratricopeptide (TPR) repeat protein